MGIEAVVEKIRKLRALATSANVNEAATAAALADRLIQEHGLSEAQLEAEGVGPKEAPVQADTPLAEYGQRAPSWAKILANRLVTHFDCACFSDTVRNPLTRERRKVVRIVGRPSDVETVRYFYAWLSVEIERLAQADARGQGRRFANGFRQGAVDGVMTAMEVSKAAARGAAKAAGASAAIVLVDAREAEADALMREKNPKLRTVSFGGRVQRDGYERGQEAGRRINRDAHLTGAGAKQLGSGS